MSVRSQSPFQAHAGSGRPLLVVAHPGHELLLHQWLRDVRPVVLVLTDGSGGAGTERIEHTQRLLAACGATPGAVFGEAPDRRFYAALLERDVDFFLELVRRTAGEIVRHRSNLVVSDAIEGCNAVHDVCSVIATLAMRLAAPEVRARRYEFPIEFRSSDGAEFRGRPEAARRELTSDELAGKTAAVRAYYPLQEEAERYLGWRERLLGEEILIALSPGRPLMPAFPDGPIYERFGRSRVDRGVYRDLITLDDHVAPLTAALHGRCGGASSRPLEVHAG